MKPILVHGHIFYPELWEELKSSILNIKPHPFDLHVTMVEKHSDLIEDIKQNFPNAKIEIIENRGYDVGPFVHVINQINLDDYSYVIKLHTKRDVPPRTILNCVNLSGNLWRSYLLSFLQSPQVFEECLKAFTDNPQIGMHGYHKLIVKYDTYDINAQKRKDELAQKHNLPIVHGAFVAGTMFICRANVLKTLQDLHLSTNDFEETKQGQSSKLAHVLERFLGDMVIYNNCILTDCLASQEEQEKHLRKVAFHHSLFAKILRFLFQMKITKSGNLSIKICKIPLPTKLFWRKKHD